MLNWEKIEYMFEELHKENFEYVILRNYEEIDEDNFYLSGHADIDFLTSNGKKFAKIIKAVPRYIEDDGIHYKVMIAGTEVAIDARSVGDGYYDSKWEKKMLLNREMKDERFFITDSINYYYSLVYHAILQKKALTDDYLNRLNIMAHNLGISATNEQQHLRVLKQFMKKYNYFYTDPYDIHVPLRKELIDDAMLKKQKNVIIRDIKIKTLQMGSKIKRTILRDNRSI